MSDLILLDTLEPGVALVTMNRPQRRNALSVDLLQQLRAVIEKLTIDRSQRVLVLRGAGAVFCSGLDLLEAADESRAEQHAALVRDVLRSLRKTQLVTIAVVQGAAFAGGGGVMAACDIVIAAEDAKFGFPEARRGLVPALITGVLQHRVREGDLRELLLVGDSVDARRAQQIGLVQRVVPAERLLDEATAMAQSILSGGPEATRLTKQLLCGMVSRTDKESDETLLEAHLASRRSGEAREGLAAFAEKRKPNWS